VPGATILGGETMVASRADWSALGSGQRPQTVHTEGRKLLDRLDVADLESEAEHDYVLLPATQADNVAVEGVGWVDGARLRRSRDAFELTLAPRGLLVARLAGESATGVTVTIDGRRAGSFSLDSAPSEVAIEVPATLRPGRHHLEILADGQTFSALHYWSYSGR
jgi:hypothetical protein